MVSKPSYAAVVSNEASPGSGKNDAPQDAPPPYSGPGSSSGPGHGSGSASQPPAPQPIPVPVQHAHHLESGPPIHIHGHPHGPTQGWAPPPTPQVARSRAIRRFWISFAYAWLIYVFVGFIIGGGVSDVRHEPVGRHGHWDKHGDWRNDVAGTSYSWFGHGGDHGNGNVGGSADSIVDGHGNGVASQQIES